MQKHVSALSRVSYIREGTRSCRCKCRGHASRRGWRVQREAQLHAMHRRLAVPRQVKTGLLGKLYQVGSCYPWRDFARELLRIASCRDPPIGPKSSGTSPLFANLCLRTDPHMHQKRARGCTRMCMSGARQSRFTRIIMARVWHRCQNGEPCGTSLNSRRTSLRGSLSPET